MIATEPLFRVQTEFADVADLFLKLLCHKFDFIIFVYFNSPQAGLSCETSFRFNERKNLPNSQNRLIFEAQLNYEVLSYTLSQTSTVVFVPLNPLKLFSKLSLTVQ